MIAAQRKEPSPAKAQATSPQATAAAAAVAPVNPVWGQLALHVQTKLAISAPDDPSEREADEVAADVMRTPQPGGGSPLIQRKCAACEEEDETVHRMPSSAATPASSSVADTIGRMHGNGAPLSKSARSFFEPRFGRDFGGVRIHTGGEPAAAAQAMSARAFTVGDDIAFAPGEFSPDGADGRRLLAHELTHTVQQQPGRIARAGDDDPLTGVEFKLVQVSPPVFEVTLTFKKSSVSITANLLAKDFLTAGRYHLSASEIVSDMEDVQEKKNTVLFTLPDHGDAYIWIHLTDEHKDKLPALTRARDFLKTHPAVTLLVTYPAKGEGDKDAGDKGDKGDKGDSAPPKFVDAEDWLKKELVPAVQGVMTEKYPSLVPDRLLGYQSAAIQASEGTDVSMIQIEKKAGDTKQIVGHVRALRSKWVDKDAGARTTYAQEVAAAVAEKMQAFGAKQRLADLEQSLDKESKGTAVPAWVLKLTKEVEKRLDLIRATSPAGKTPPADLPDKIHVDPWGNDFYFRLIVEEKASDAPEKTAWNSARMTPALREDQLDDVDGLVKIVRQQTALLRARPVSTEKEEDKALTKLLMPEIPSEISSSDLNANGATVTGGENTFTMSVRIDQYFPYTTDATGRPTLEGVSLADALRLPWIDYEWKTQRLTADNAAQLVTAPAKPDKDNQPSEVYYDLSNKDIDQKSKIELARQKIKYASIVDDPAYPTLATTHGSVKTGFKEPGAYLILCRVTPNALTRDTYRQIFPPSKAVFPVRVESADRLAKESVLENPDALADKQKQLSDNKDLTDKDRADLKKEVDRIKSEEGMSHLQLTQLGLSQLEEKIGRFQALKTWMLDDRKQHPTTVGTETENPFVVRLMLQDKVHGTKLFDTWHELYSFYGERAYNVAHLDQPETTEDGRLNPLNEYLKYLDDQKKSLGKLIGTITAEQARFLGGHAERPVATLVAKDTGQTIPLFLMVGETPDSKENAYKYRIVDLTLRATPLYERKDHVYVGAVSPTRADAIRAAFVNYGEDNKYPEGNVFYRFPPDTTVNSVPNIKTVGEYAEQVAMVLALIGAIAAVAASGGAATPGLVAVAAWIGVANAVLATALAAHHLQQRSERGTFEMDADATLEIITVIASVVSLGAAARAAQLGKAAQAAQAAGASARTAQALGQIQRLGKLMLVFDVVTLGSTAVVTSVKVSDDVARIKALNLPKAQEDALLQEVSFEAMTQGAMLAFQTVMMARTHLEAYRSKIEGSRYQSFEERGWFDENGNPTQKAPPFLRMAGEGKEPAFLEKPPIKLEDELPLLRQAAEAGEVVPEPEGSEYDASVKIKLENNEEHSYKRRRSDGTWCRHTDKFCFISKKDIDRIVEAIGAFDQPAPGKTGAPRPVKPATGGKAKGNWATLTQDIQTTIEAAVTNLRAKLGKKWLLPWIYGTKLHKEFADLFKGMTLPKGWQMMVEKPLRMFAGVKAATLKMTVKEFLTASHPELIPELPEGLLSQRIGALEPDLVLIAPDGTLIVWDLAPSSQSEHLAKTMLYAHVLGEPGKITQIGESYYKWQTHIELNTTEQSRSQGSKPDPSNGVVTLTDKQILSLMKEHAGSGKTAKGTVTAGVDGAVEMITDNDKVVGRFYDGQKWRETTNFSIHYTDDGLFIRPEAP